jgi:tripartite-type tricarboxylate transporter receptor subunit TctC
LPTRQRAQTITASVIGHGKDNVGIIRSSISAVRGAKVKSQRLQGSDLPSRRRRPELTRRGFIAGMAFSLIPGTVSANNPFDGELLRILIGGAAGGSYDQTARFVTSALAARLPRTRVVAENSPKAGGRLMAKEIAEAPPTGTVIGFVPTGLIYAQILGESGIAFDLARLEWIVSINTQHRVLVVAKKLGIASVAELIDRETPLNVPARSTSSASYYDPLLLNAALGTKLRPIPGYSSGQRSTALLGGEVGGIVASYDAVEGIVEAGHALVLLRLGRGEPLPQLRNIPSPGDIANSPTLGDIIDLIEIHDHFGRFVATAPGVPGDRLRFLRLQFQDILTDPQFIAAAKRARIEISPTPGNVVDDRLKRLLKGSGDDIGQRLKAALACGHRRAEGAGSC